MNDPERAKPLVLLVAVDGSANADAALRWVSELSATGIALRCVLLNVQPPIMVGEVGVVAPAAIALPQRERSATEVLERAARVVADAGIRCSTEHGIDDAATAIVACAKGHGCEAVVMGRRGHGALRAALLGSVSTAVVRESPVPVIVVHERDAATLHAPLRILVATDGSEPALRATRFALRLAGASPGAEIHLAFAVPPLTVGGAMFGPRERLLEHWSRSDVERALSGARALADAAGCRCVTHALQAVSPGAAIVHAADEIGASLIAMGTRGFGNVAGLLLGSAALHVVEHARVAVALTR